MHARLDDGSPVSGDVHAGFCERRGVQLPPATHLGQLLEPRGAEGSTKR